MPEVINKLTKAWVLIDTIIKHGAWQSFIFHAGFSREKTMDVEQWETYQEIEYTSFKGGHNLIENMEVPCVDEGPWYLIWYHTTTGGGWTEFKYRLGDPVCPPVCWAYQFDEEMPDDFYFKIYGEAGEQPPGIPWLAIVGILAAVTIGGIYLYYKRK